MGVSPMAMNDAYMTVEEFRLRAGQIGEEQDDAIASVLLAASRQIDGYCGQQFNQGETATPRYATPVDQWLVDVPAFVSLESLDVDGGDRTYSTAWESTDYDLLPYGAEDDGRPYTQIAVAVNGRYGFSFYPRSVRVTAIWGWPSVPPQVKEACYLLANRGKSLWTAPFGQTGAGEMGAGLNMTAALTPLIKEMLGPFVVMPV